MKVFHKLGLCKYYINSLSLGFESSIFLKFLSFVEKDYLGSFPLSYCRETSILILFNLILVFLLFYGLCE